MILLPNRVEDFEGTRKGLALGLIFCISNIFYAILSPIFGHLSDQTPHLKYFGQRKLYIAIFGIGQAVGLWLLFIAPNIWALGIIFTFLTTLYAIGGGPLIALLAE